MTNKELQTRHDLEESASYSVIIKEELELIKSRLENFKKLVPETEEVINQILSECLPLEQVEKLIKELGKLNKENVLQIEINEQYKRWLETDEGSTASFNLWLNKSLKNE